MRSLIFTSDARTHARSQGAGQTRHGFCSGSFNAAVCSFKNQMLRSRPAGFIWGQAASHGASAHKVQWIISCLEISDCMFNIFHLFLSQELSVEEASQKNRKGATCRHAPQLTVLFQNDCLRVYSSAATSVFSSASASASPYLASYSSIASTVSRMASCALAIM